eukprot:TRINITY_DN3761_c0_g1_i14.p4 TRINITY_DN3761_c0_g1~~TRINITY_DN3761_c0_g1_i14.p4  ORF type:complete len:110 (-),score=12.99 TRINITY_DN3761_c0_g1_i14:92-421(-)
MKANDKHVTVVVEDTESKKIVATATVFGERKILRNGGLACHVEDVVVDKDIRAVGLGKSIILALRDIAEAMGAYKMLLDCKPENASFYEKVGFARKEIQMALYLSLIHI